MNNYATAAALMLAAYSAPAQSADFSLNAENTNFSGGMGIRRVATGETKTKLGGTTFVVSASQGQWKLNDRSYAASRLSGSIYRDWSSTLSTRTSLGVASDRPVFATREALQEISYKLIPGAVATVGAGYRKYADGVQSTSLSAGAAWYFGGGSLSYRFTGYDVRSIGHAHAHLVSARLSDPSGGGSTQLWLGHGTSLHDYQFLPLTSSGKFNSLMLRRSQPLAGPIAIDAGIGKTWYDTGITKYRGTTFQLGFSIRPPVAKKRVF